MKLVELEVYRKFLVEVKNGHISEKTSRDLMLKISSSEYRKLKFKKYSKYVEIKDFDIISIGEEKELVGLTIKCSLTSLDGKTSFDVNWNHYEGWGEFEKVLSLMELADSVMKSTAFN